MNPYKGIILSERGKHLPGSLAVPRYWVHNIFYEHFESRGLSGDLKLFPSLKLTFLAPENWWLAQIYL